MAKLTELKNKSGPADTEAEPDSHALTVEEKLRMNAKPILIGLGIVAAVPLALWVLRTRRAGPAMRAAGWAASIGQALLQGAASRVGIDERDVRRLGRGATHLAHRGRDAAHDAHELAREAYERTLDAYHDTRDARRQGAKLLRAAHGGAGHAWQERERVVEAGQGILAALRAGYDDAQRDAKRTGERAWKAARPVYKDVVKAGRKAKREHRFW